MQAYSTFAASATAAPPLPIADYMVAGLYNFVAKIDGAATPGRVFLRAGGTLDFLSGEDHGEGEGDGESESRAVHGHWGILPTDEIELAMPQHCGQPAITWTGRVAGDRVGAKNDDGSELVRINGRIEEVRSRPRSTTFTLLREHQAPPLVAPLTRPPHRARGRFASPLSH